MKKLLVLVMVCSVMMIGVSAIAQDNMGQDSSGAKAATPPLKMIKGTIKADGDKYTFVSDKDQKSWDIMNPDAVKGHEGHHVEVSAHVYKDKGAIHIMKVSMLQ
jgi:hypothetical protein